jgi:hypothetical protein
MIDPTISSIENKMATIPEAVARPAPVHPGPWPANGETEEAGMAADHLCRKR